MKERICFFVYKDWEDAFSELDDKTFRELITSIFQYGFRKEESELSPMAKIVMKLIRPTLDRDWEKYENLCNRNKTNGLNGGRGHKKNETQANPENPVGLLETQENPKKLKNEKGNKIKEKRNNEINILDDKSSLSSSEKDDSENTDINYQEIFSYYNTMMKGKAIPSMRALTEQRKKAIHARYCTFGKDAIFEVIAKAAESRFLNGENNRGWTADATWLFCPTNFTKVLEGRYDNDRMNRYGTVTDDSTQQALRVGANAVEDIFKEMEADRRA